MAKYKTKRVTRYENMSEIDKAKANIAKYEFLAEYFQNVIDQKTIEAGGDTSDIDYEFYKKQYAAECKASKIVQKYLTLDALSMSYNLNKNKKLFNVAELMEKIYDFFEANTKFSRDYVKECINQNLYSVEIVKEFEGHSTGIGCFDSIFKELMVKEKEINNGGLEKLLRHEFTHLLGNVEIKDGHITGYGTEPYTFDKENQEMTKYSNNFIMKLIRKITKKDGLETKNIQFNEACVEMFARKDEPLEEKNIKDYWNMDVTLYTNFSEGSLYIFNANLVRQMITAKGISEDDLFKGLFDYRHAKNVMKRFGMKNFDEISKGMDRIGERTNEVADSKYGSEEEKNSLENLKSEISNTEKIIIDKILLPRINKMKGTARQELLERYYKFVVVEHEYFKEKTGFVPAKNDPDTEEKRFKEGLYVKNEPIIVPANKEKNSSEKSNSLNHQKISKNEGVEL